MSIDRDHVVLSPRELRALARMESEVVASDPALEARMVMGRPRRWLAWRPSMGVAVPLLCAGMALVVLTVPLSPWLAFAGVVIMGVALHWMLSAALARMPQRRRTTGPRRPAG